MLTASSVDLARTTKLMQFRKPALFPFSATYDVTSENADKGQVLQGHVKVSLVQDGSHWVYSETGSYDLLTPEGQVEPHSWNYTFREADAGDTFVFEYQVKQGETVHHHHKGSAFYDALAKKVAITWEVPSAHTALLGREVLFPLAFKRRVLGAFKDKPKTLSLYLFDGRTTKMLPAVDVAMARPRLVFHRKRPSDDAPSPLLVWPLQLAFYHEKTPAKKLAPSRQEKRFISEAGVDVRHTLTLGGVPLICVLRAGSFRRASAEKVESIPDPTEATDPQPQTRA